MARPALLPEVVLLAPEAIDPTELVPVVVQATAIRLDRIKEK